MLDDVALIARSAASSLDDVGTAATKVTAKTAGVVVDDAAVTPRYVAGVKPSRELPVIWRIARGSLVNKLIIILPVALLLSAYAPWLLTPILMVGGSYLSYEGAEKIAEHSGITGSSDRKNQAQNALPASSGQTQQDTATPTDEDSLVRSAILTDLILSTEIMMIALNEVAGQPLLDETLTLILVGIALTVLVYGSVGILVKIDDVGLTIGGPVGRAMVRIMPTILSVLSIMGVFAMLWVGGHILIEGCATLGWAVPLHVIESFASITSIGVLSWLIETAFLMAVALVIGGLIVLAVAVLPRSAKRNS